MTDPTGQEFWAQWEYSREVWSSWTLYNLANEKREAKNVLLWTLLPAASAGLGAVQFRSQLWQHPMMAGGLIGAAVGFAIAGLVTINPMFTYWSLHRGPAEVTIGPGGMRRGKRYFPWHTRSLDLRTVSLIEGPRCELQFGFDIRRTAARRFNFRVPVPAGYEKAASEIVAHVREAAELAR